MADSAALLVDEVFPEQPVRPLDFIARLAALVPKPRVNLTRLHIP